MLCRSALVALLLVSSAAMAKPEAKITKVKFKTAGSSFNVAISGTNFGSSPVTLPCNSCTAPELKFIDNANFRTAETPNILTWTNTSITLSGVTGAKGDSISLVVTNDQLASIATAGGNFPGSHPRIKSLSFSGKGKNLTMTITGTGFGAAPSGIPGSIDIPYFQFLNWRAVDGYSAGYTGQGYTDTLTLNYSSWSDTQILIDGFGSAYGEDGWTAKPKNPFIITIYSTQGAIIPGQTGPQTSIGGRLP
jgi:hypothetical protein